MKGGGGWKAVVKRHTPIYLFFVCSPLRICWPFYYFDPLLLLSSASSSKIRRWLCVFFSLTRSLDFFFSFTTFLFAPLLDFLFKKNKSKYTAQAPSNRLFMWRRSSSAPIVFTWGHVFLLLAAFLGIDERTNNVTTFELCWATNGSVINDRRINRRSYQHWIYGDSLFLVDSTAPKGGQTGSKVSIANQGRS